MVYCIHCGKQNSDDAETCSSCGKHLQTPAGRGERERYRARPTQRSSDACWEEADWGEGLTRGNLLVLGVILIGASLLITWALVYTANFEAFWNNVGNTIINFFGRRTDQIIMLVGPIIFVIGVIIIFYALLRSKD